MAASSAMVQNLFSPTCHYNYKNQTLALTHSHFLSSPSFLRLKRKTLSLNTRISRPLSAKPLVFALQSNFFKVVQTALKIGKDGIEAGTNLVPGSIPRPIARVSVTVAAVAVTLFVLKSFLSTVFFGLATMGFVYFIFIALNKDQGPKRGSSAGNDTMEDPVEEARKIMEKYK